MFEKQVGVFLYALSPVHMGTGSALGAIDSPIQRERHTDHPMMAGTGIKGALRHHLQVQWKGSDVIDTVFGPDTTAAEHFAGAVSFADAQIVLFPVRSLRETYVYATCPTVLERTRRRLSLAGCRAVEGWDIPEVGDDKAVVLSDKLVSNGNVVLESYAMKAIKEEAQGLSNIANWLGDNVLPAGEAAFEYFTEKVKDHLVLLSDNRFNFFVRNATVVEPHVRIDQETGTASDGGLFYVENLPSETVMLSVAMISRERRGGPNARTPAEILSLLRDGPGGDDGIHRRMVQVGGDATTGRGQVMVTMTGEERA